MIPCFVCKKAGVCKHREVDLLPTRNIGQRLRYAQETDMDEPYESGLDRMLRELKFIKLRANGLVQRAIKAGTLIRPLSCDECGKACEPDAHHEDYLKPLDVRWLCHKHHAQADGARRRREKRAEENTQ